MTNGRYGPDFIAEAHEHVWGTPEEALNMPVEHYTIVVIREYLKRKSRAGA